MVFLLFTENELSELEKSSNIVVELPQKLNNEALINSSLSTKNNCSDSGTNNTFYLFKKIQCKVCVLLSNVYFV